MSEYGLELMPADLGDSNKNNDKKQPKPLLSFSKKVLAVILIVFALFVATILIGSAVEMDIVHKAPSTLYFYS